MVDKESLIELNRLWKPIRPFLVEQVAELYGRRDGRVLEVGPFSGLAFELARGHVGSLFCITVFPGEILTALKEERHELQLEEVVTIVASDQRLSGVAAEAFDLVVFRGAFFFPSFFKPDLKTIFNFLDVGGTAVLGGGFGTRAPTEIIQSIETRSRTLNQMLGRIRITEAELWSTIEAAGLREYATVITEGGLWVVLRKQGK